MASESQSEEQLNELKEPRCLDKEKRPQLLRLLPDHLQHAAMDQQLPDDESAAQFMVHRNTLIIFTHVYGQPTS
jgi:hypothetical protein